MPWLNFGLFDCLFLVGWALRLSGIFGFLFIVGLLLNDIAFLLYLSDIQPADLASAMLQRILLDFPNR